MKDIFPIEPKPPGDRIPPARKVNPREREALPNMFFWLVFGVGFFFFLLPNRFFAFCFFSCLLCFILFYYSSVLLVAWWDSHMMWHNFPSFSKRHVKNYGLLSDSEIMN